MPLITLRLIDTFYHYFDGVCPTQMGGAVYVAANQLPVAMSSISAVFCSVTVSGGAIFIDAGCVG